MRIQFVVTAFLLIFNLVKLNGQPTELFWGGPQIDFTSKIIPLGDGNLMTVGATRVDQKYQIDLTKRSSTGAMIWEIILPSEDWETANSISPTSDGGYIAIGATYDFPQDTNYFNKNLLVVKLDSNGSLQWRKSFPYWSDGYSVLETTNHEYLIGTMNDPPGISEKAALVRLDNQGNLLWSKTFTFKDANRLKQVLPAPGGGYFLVGRAYDIGASFSGIFFTKVAENGNLIWNKLEDTGFFGESTGKWSASLGTVQLSDGSVIIANMGGAGGNYGYQTTMLKYAPSGNLLWKRKYNNAPDESNLAFDLQLCADGKTLLVSGESGLNLSPKKGFAMMVDTAGYEHWRGTYGGDGDSRFLSALCMPDSSLIFVGTSESGGNGQYDHWLLRINDDGNILPFNIGGEVWIDMNGDCIIDSFDIPAKNWLLSLNGQTFLFTNEHGQYNVNVEQGNYLIRLIPPASFWSVCSNDITVLVDSLTPNLTQNFLVKPEQTCPIVELGITTPDLVRCDTSVVFATWTHAGVLTEQAQALEVKLGEGLTIVQASEPFIQDSQLVIFEIGDIGKFESGTIKFNVALSCSAPLGAAHCIEARLMESIACPPTWLGPFLSINGECRMDSAHFVLSNIGSDSMMLSQQFRLFEDGILVQNVDFTLAAGDSLFFKVLANGKTMRLETEQVAGYPELSRPSATIEGCGQGENGFASTGTFSIFHHDEGALNTTFACVENTTNGIPNKIVEQPEGYGRYHFLGPNTQNEYVIRFKNPYPDTAKEVRIRLKLSEFLDLPTFRMTAWSHPFSIRTVANGDIEILIENANIPPVSINENGAYCFLRFRINQLPDVADQSYISNRAEAYFDYRGPLQLIGSWHNIYSNYIATSPSPITKSPESFQYGDRSGIDFGEDIAESVDGNIYLIGTTLSFSNDYDGFLVKTDENGKGIWYNAYDINNGHEIFYTVAPTSDGGCIAVGTYEEPGEIANDYNDYDILAVRINTDGEMLWHKKLRLSGNRGGIAADMVTSPDGNFVIAGYCWVGGGFGQFLMKIDENGQVIWSNSYSYPYGEQINTEQVINTPDGGFLITGSITQLAWEPDIFIQKVSSNGNAQWSKSFNKENIYQVASAAVASDNNIVLVGTIGIEDDTLGYVSTPYLLKISSNGNEIWEKHPYVGKENRARGKKIISSPDNGFYVLGQDYNYSQSENDLMIIKYNANGDTIWTKTFDTGTENEPRNLIFTSQEKIMAIAYSQPDNWLYDLQTLLLTAEHTHNPSTNTDEKLALNSQWQLYPNPTTGKITLFNPLQESDVFWVLYNTNGVQLSRGEFSSKRQVLDFSKVQEGLYFLHINDEAGANTMKFFISK